MMGGRGSSGRRGNGKSSGLFPVFKVSRSLAKTFSRSQLETLATAIFANDGMKSGLSRTEAVTRGRSLIPFNTTAQLRNYVVKHSQGYPKI